MLQIKIVVSKLKFTTADVIEDVTRSFRFGIRILKKLSFEDDFIGLLLEYAEAIV